MLKDCKFDIWNWKYNQFTPLEILEKLDSKLVRVREYAWKISKTTGEKEVIEEIETVTFLEMIRNIDTWEFDQTKMFPEGARILVSGYGLIVDHVKIVPEGFRIYYKYIQASEEKIAELKEQNPNWCFINSFGYQFKKINPKYNFITVGKDDRVLFLSGELSGLDRLKEEYYRRRWYFDDAVDEKTTVYLEKALGLVRDDGLTWWEFLAKSIGEGEIPISIKLKDERLFWTDVKDPKNPIFPDWVSVSGKNVEIKKDLSVSELITDISEYLKKKKEDI